METVVTKFSEQHLVHSETWVNTNHYYLIIVLLWSCAFTQATVLRRKQMTTKEGKNQGFHRERKQETSNFYLVSYSFNI